VLAFIFRPDLPTDAFTVIAMQLYNWGKVSSSTSFFSSSRTGAALVINYH
jgi:hypothetical protein